MKKISTIMSAVSSTSHTAWLFSGLKSGEPVVKLMYMMDIRIIIMVIKRNTSIILSWVVVSGMTILDVIGFVR